MKSMLHSYGIFPVVYDSNDSDQLLSFKEDNATKE